MLFIFSSTLSYVNCPAVICLPNTILSCGETPLVNCGPRSFLLILLYNPLLVFLLQTILFPFDTINPLFSARPVRLTTSLSSWGRVIWLCCAGLYFNLGVILVSFWFDNLGSIMREILAAVYIITFLLGRPTVLKLQGFLAPLSGRKEAILQSSPLLAQHHQRIYGA